MIATKCPLCQGNLDNLYHTRTEQTEFQYECTGCKHGWSITTLQQVAYARLAGKSDEEIREIILKEDKVNARINIRVNININEG